MNWNDYIQIWAAVATLVTAATALLTVLEMRWQRQSGYKPDIVVESAELILYRMPDIHSPGFKSFKAATRTHGKTAAGPEAAPTVICRNIGSGTAKYVEYAWIFDVSGYSERIREIDPNGKLQYPPTRQDGWSSKPTEIFSRLRICRCSREAVLPR